MDRLQVDFGRVTGRIKPMLLTRTKTTRPAMTSRLQTNTSAPSSPRAPGRSIAWAARSSTRARSTTRWCQRISASGRVCAGISSAIIRRAGRTAFIWTSYTGKSGMSPTAATRPARDGRAAEAVRHAAAARGAVAPQASWPFSQSSASPRHSKGSRSQVSCSTKA